MGSGIEVWLIPFGITIQIYIRQINFQCIFFPTHDKLKSFVETFPPYNQILMFEEQLCMSYMDFQAQINSAATIQQKLGIDNRHSKKNVAPPSQEDK